MEPEDFLESSLELNTPSPTSDLFASGVEYHYGKSGNAVSVASSSGKVETKQKNSLAQNHQQEYYVQTSLNSGNIIFYCIKKQKSSFN